MKNTESTVISNDPDLYIDGVRVYAEPTFVTTRNTTRIFYCKDDKGHLIAEFLGMNKLTNYVCKKAKRSASYVKQRVYRYLNKKVKFLGYYWSDKK